jgi:hypothetical protein
LCGGLWFAGKMIHHLTWRGFSHGGALAGFAAGAATMVAPVHRLSSAGFMAEALGANRDGGNSAVNFMKRVGLATQGLGSASSDTQTRLSGGSAAMSAAADLLAAGGPPDMAASLGADGQSAIAGAEKLFSQHAFNAFGAANSKLIGSSTRDLPYGSVSSGDRAKLAWSRTPPRQQAAFTSDFLSEWLGTGPESTGDASVGVGLPPVEAGIV